MPVFVPKEFSYNPCKVHCPLCLRGVDVMLMVGDTHRFICAGCGFVHLGKPNGGGCVRCKCTILNDTGVPGGDDSFPNVSACPECVEKAKKVEAIIQLGGVRFRCVSCGSIGAFKGEDPRAIDLRQRGQGKTSFEIDKSNCPNCINNESCGDKEPQGG